MRCRDDNETLDGALVKHMHRDYNISGVEPNNPHTKSQVSLYFPLTSATTHIC